MNIAMDKNRDAAFQSDPGYQSDLDLKSEIRYQ